MSAHVPCRCPDRAKARATTWRVTQRNCNHSAFNGYRMTPSEWSCVVCTAPDCPGIWRTKARYVDELPDAKRGEW